MSQAVTLPDGTYGAADPDKPDVITLWWVFKSKLKAWPKGQRWAPFPPPVPEDVKGYRERAEWRQDWYDDVYFAWKDKVIAAIAADLEAAAARFDEHVPVAERPVIPGSGKKPKTDTEIRRALRVADMRQAGKTFDQIADELREPKTTVWRRAKEGEELYQQLEAALVRAGESSVYGIAADLFAAEEARGDRSAS